MPSSALHPCSNPFSLSSLLPVLVYTALCAIWSPFGRMACILALLLTVATTLCVETNRTVPSGYTLGESEPAAKRQSLAERYAQNPRKKDSDRQTSSLDHARFDCMVLIVLVTKATIQYILSGPEDWISIYKL
jgi:hypothetical protein